MNEIYFFIFIRGPFEHISLISTSPFAILLTDSFDHGYVKNSYHTFINNIYARYAFFPCFQPTLSYFSRRITFRAFWRVEYVYLTLVSSVDTHSFFVLSAFFIVIFWPLPLTFFFGSPTSSLISSQVLYVSILLHFSTVLPPPSSYIASTSSSFLTVRSSSAWQIPQSVLFFIMTIISHR